MPLKSPPIASSSTTEFQSVSASLADLIGPEPVRAACRARALLTGEDATKLAAAASEPVEFLPAGFLQRQHGLLPKVGEQVVAAVPSPTQRRGASTRMFNAATNPGRAPLSASGIFRVGEDGRLYLIAKSEHYHTPLGHAFPGFALLDQARRIGIPNGTHNNTRGQITRQLEEELVAAVNGVDVAQPGALTDLVASSAPCVCNRVLNLETGSLAVEAALKMILARFYRMEPGGADPKYRGSIPVILVMGNEQGGFQANYHGTTILAQTLRGMWPDFYGSAEKSGLYRVQPIRPNHRADLEAAFARWEGNGHKIAGFFHEIVMMNYGGLLLTGEFLQRAYELCRQHDVPAVVDEIQSCLWHHDLFMFREWGLTPSFVAIGKGFSGGEYPASRLIFSAAFDTMPQFGALVTNGQEELASLAYLVTMRWARANARATRAVGDYYEQRLRDFAAAHPDQITAVEGKRHMTTLFFKTLESAKAFVRELNRRGFDLSAQTYKADCPPAVLTKIPLITTPVVVDFMIERMTAAIAAR